MSTSNAMKIAISGLGNTPDNFKGHWENLTGSLLAGDVVKHKGSYWTTKIAIADVTLNEPSSINTDWFSSIDLVLGTYYTNS